MKRNFETSSPSNCEQNKKIKISQPNSVKDDNENWYPNHICDVTTSIDFIKVGLSREILKNIPQKLFLKTNISCTQAVAVLLMLKQFFHHRQESIYRNNSLGNRGGFICADGTGLGKTRIMSSCFYNLIEAHKIENVKAASSATVVVHSHSNNNNNNTPPKFCALWVTLNATLFGDIVKELEITHPQNFQNLSIYSLKDYLNIFKLKQQQQSNKDINNENNEKMLFPDGCKENVIILTTYNIIHRNIHYLIQLSSLINFNIIFFDEFHTIRNTSPSYNSERKIYSEKNYAFFEKYIKSLIEYRSSKVCDFNVADCGDFFVRLYCSRSFFVFSSATPFTEDSNLANIDFLIDNTFKESQRIDDEEYPGNGCLSEIHSKILSIIRMGSPKGSTEYLGLILKLMYHYGVYNSRVISMKGVKCIVKKLKIDPVIHTCFKASSNYINYLLKFWQENNCNVWNAKINKGVAAVSSLPTFENLKNTKNCLTNYNTFYDDDGDLIDYVEISLKNISNLKASNIQDSKQEINILWRKFHASVVYFFKNLILNAKSRECASGILKYLSLEGNTSKVIFTTEITGESSLGRVAQSVFDKRDCRSTNDDGDGNTKADVKFCERCLNYYQIKNIDDKYDDADDDCKFNHPIIFSNSTSPKLLNLYETVSTACFLKTIARYISILNDENNNNDNDNIKIFFPHPPSLNLLRWMPLSFIDYMKNVMGLSACVEVTNRPLMQIRDDENSGCFYVVSNKRNLWIDNNNNNNNNEALYNFNNNPNVKGIVISSKGCTGINLHDSVLNHSSGQRLHLFCDLPYSPAKVIQHMGRSHRTNQNTKPTIILFALKAITAEERFSTILEERLGDQKSGTFGNRHCGAIADILNCQAQTIPPPQKTISPSSNNNKDDNSSTEEATTSISTDMLNKQALYRIILCYIYISAGGMSINKSSFIDSDTNEFLKSLFNDNEKLFSTYANFQMVLSFALFMRKYRKDVISIFYQEPSVNDPKNDNLFVRCSYELLNLINKNTAKHVQALNKVMIIPSRFQRLLFLIQQSCYLWFMRKKKVQKFFLARKHDVVVGLVIKYQNDDDYYFNSSKDYRIKVRIFNSEIKKFLGKKCVDLTNENSTLIQNYGSALKHTYVSTPITKNNPKKCKKNFKSKFTENQLYFKQKKLIIRLMETLRSSKQVDFIYRYAIYPS